MPEDHVFHTAPPAIFESSQADTRSVKERLYPFRIDDRADPFGVVSELALADDLRLLMRGPGAQPGQHMSRIGPALRTMCGIASSDSPVDAVEAVAAWLRARISSLDSDAQRTYAVFAFGLDERAQLPWARPRLLVAADHLGRSYAVARRHVMNAITVIAGTTRPSQSVPVQLRSHSDSWVDLGIAHGNNHHDSHESSGVSGQVGSQSVLTTRCFLLAVARPADQQDKVYAIVRSSSDHEATDETDDEANDEANDGVATAIPAVWVRHVTPVPPADSDAANARAHEW